ncbi:sperm-associated antigen 1-like isoform X2 [Vespa mandarinia]|uniref:sperm-associated antigen 1-like isoform X2 n=1 Tax=Vespa mandarinia TaxID=7446 RepID=UPI0016215E10|nr:sperm-associated antigen 1-like isoform X2 [Vespa mandarinia]
MIKILNACFTYHRHRHHHLERPREGRTLARRSFNMVTEEADLITVPKPEKKSLLEKYEIPLENLSYEYITECTNGKTLERIVIILRSGEEGIYPDLTRHAEERLAIIKPNSTVLRKILPVLTRKMLLPDECKELDNDINDWTREMHCREKDLNDGKISLLDDPSLIPEIRHTEEISTMKKDNKERYDIDRKSKRIASCDYAAWDKYDVDTEINRIDLQDERKQIEAKEIQRRQKDMEKKRKENSKEIILNKSSFTGTEIDVIAEQERKKGNEAFRIGDYVDALRFYDSSIAINSCPIAYNNRAMTLIKLQRYEDALNDCNIVLSEDDKNIKALLRRALCLENLDKKQKALTDYETILKLEPTNRTAIAGINKLRKPCESKRVRMKIEEETSSNEISKIVGGEGDTEKINIIKKCLSKSSNKKIENVIENNICICERGPGPSHSNKPLPHIKENYCLQNESKRILSNCNEINLGLTNINLSSSNNATSNELTSILIGQESKSIKHNKQKSIFSCKTRSTSGVVIEEIPNDQSYTKKIKSIDRKDNEEIKTNHNTINGNKSNSLEKNNEIKRKYNDDESCRKEDKTFMNLENISSPYEFLRAWQSLKDDNDLKIHARLLRTLKFENLSTVIGNKLDGNMFSLILRCLEQHFCKSEDYELLVRYLKSISQLSRFSIVKMFMDNNDKKALSNIFQFLKDQESKEVSVLREVYI